MSIWGMFTQLLPQFPLASVPSVTTMHDLLSASAADWRTQLAEASAAGHTTEADALSKKLVSAQTLLSAMESEQPSTAIETAHARMPPAAAGPMTTDQLETERLRHYREVEAHAVFTRNGKVEAIVYRDGTSIMFGEVPAGASEFCANQQANGEAGAIERAQKFAELYGEGVTVTTFGETGSAPTRGHFMDLEVIHPGMIGVSLVDVFTWKDEDTRDRGRRRDETVRDNPPVHYDAVAVASISTK